MKTGHWAPFALSPDAIYAAGAAGALGVTAGALAEPPPPPVVGVLTFGGRGGRPEAMSSI